MVCGNWHLERESVCVPSSLMASHAERGGLKQRRRRNGLVGNLEHHHRMRGFCLSAVIVQSKQQPALTSRTLAAIGNQLEKSSNGFL